jgi:hypothetical protein
MAKYPIIEFIRDVDLIKVARLRIYPVFKALQPGHEHHDMFNTVNAGGNTTMYTPGVFSKARDTHFMISCFPFGCLRNACNFVMKQPNQDEIMNTVIWECMAAGEPTKGGRTNPRHVSIGVPYIMIVNPKYTYDKIVQISTNIDREEKLIRLTKYSDYNIKRIVALSGFDISDY